MRGSLSHCIPKQVTVPLQTGAKVFSAFQTLSLPIYPPHQLKAFWICVESAVPVHQQSRHVDHCISRYDPSMISTSLFIRLICPSAAGGPWNVICLDLWSIVDMNVKHHFDFGHDLLRLGLKSLLGTLAVRCSRGKGRIDAGCEYYFERRWRG